MAGDKPAVLIVGGLGYVGRYLAKHIHDNKLASELRLVDKQLPPLASLSPEFQDACSGDKFMQADASRERKLPLQSLEPKDIDVVMNFAQFFPKIFDRSNGEQWDFVFNCGGETRYSQEDEVYRTRSYDLSMKLGREAAKRKIPCFIECSTGQIYKPNEKPRKETDPLKPWSKLAKWKLAACEGLAQIEGLNLVLLRFANIYGPYTKGYLSTGLCLARVYQDLGKEMKWLWDENLMTNTVHVTDAARALWTAASWYRGTGQKPKKGAAPIFNIVDHGKTSQGTMAALIHTIFKIPTGFQGTVISQFARLNLDHVTEDVNEETLDHWAELQKKAGIPSGPISPFMEAELLRDTDLSLDGSKFEKETGFKYEKLAITESEVRDVIESFKRMQWWP